MAFALRRWARCRFLLVGRRRRVAVGLGYTRLTPSDSLPFSCLFHVLSLAVLHVMPPDNPRCCLG